jgi:hypothetical protein
VVYKKVKKITNSFAYSHATNPAATPRRKARRLPVHPSGAVPGGLFP